MRASSAFARDASCSFTERIESTSAVTFVIASRTRKRERQLRLEVRLRHGFRADPAITFSGAVSVLPPAVSRTV